MQKTQNEWNWKVKSIYSSMITEYDKRYRANPNEAYTDFGVKITEKVLDILNDRLATLVSEAYIRKHNTFVPIEDRIKIHFNGKA